MRTILALCLLVPFFVSSLHAGEWAPVEGLLLSKFAKDVDPNAPHPEYPRPQLIRKDWKNLNGLWDYSITPVTASGPAAAQGKILVPYPLESALSGVGKRLGKDDVLHYTTHFEVPAEWNIGKDGPQGVKRLLLHFGAVDWECSVFVNGQLLGKHTGGYAPFSFDITDALRGTGPQRLEVSVFDPTDASWQPRGKQVAKPGGIWYTPVSGIWQTVWLEPVTAAHITRTKAVADLEKKTVEITAWAEGAESGDRYAVIVRDGSIVVASNGGALPGTPLTVKILDPKHWSPETPFLYDMKVVLMRDNKPVDEVDSYFAIRECILGKDEHGFVRPLLNGKFLFQHGPLDQGWWPDGLYTPPTDAALKYDLEITKAMGFNMVRKHVKVESARFYHHCDRMGLLVWQDMPSGDKHISGSDLDLVRSPESAENYEREWMEIIRSLEFFPSIVVWIPFNEGWGQFDTARIVELTRALDPSRLVDAASGWTDRGVGDFFDIHPYPGPAMPKLFDDRISVMGEYGGLGLPVKGHSWKEEGNWGYQSFEDREALFGRYKQLNVAMHPMIANGLSAAVYTQTTDVEIEVNGLMSYDREVVKFDPEKMKAANDALHFAPPTYTPVVPTAQTAPRDWAYTTEKPADGWEHADFDASGWQTGSGGFGTEGTPGAVVGTKWNTPDIWLRTTVEIPESVLAETAPLALSLHHDEDAEVFVNGVPVLQTKNHTSDYQTVALDAAARSAFKPGKNVIAVHCKQTTGGQYIDVGIMQSVPATETKRVW